MQVNFIGHGLDPSNKKTVGDDLATAFGDERFDVFYGFVAFASIAGVNRIQRFILANKNRFSHIRFYIGVDDNGTSKEALQSLIDNQIETYIFHTRSVMIFHPKLFIFEGATWTKIIIGSSNLTNAGLFLNAEASVSIDFHPKDKQGNKLINQIKKYYSTLIDLTDRNIERLTPNLLKNLCNGGLVLNEGKTTKKEAENSNLLNELGIFPDRDKLQVLQNELGKAKTVKEKKQYDKNSSVTSTDLEVFPYFLTKYIEHIKAFPSGIVSRTIEDKSFYKWFVRMRDFYGLKILPLDFEINLNKAGFPFGDAQEALRLWKWDRRFDELLDYMRKYNMSFAYVPQHKSKTHPYHSLGQWFAHQKQRRNNEHPPPITEHENEKFNIVNFKWERVNVGGLRDDDHWLENYFRLQEFESEFNHSNPSQTDKNPEIRKLGKWVNDQITLHNMGRMGKNGERKFLIKERLELLEEIKVDWNWQINKYKNELEKKIAAYLHFRKIYPDEKPKNGDNRFKKIVEWKSLIRYRYKDSIKDEDKWRIDRLNEIGFPW